MTSPAVAPARPLTPADLGSCFTSERGIPLLCLGEDGQWVLAFGWYAADAFVAAVNQYVRKELDLVNAFDDAGADWSDLRAAVSHGRARIITDEAELRTRGWYDDGEDSWALSWEPGPGPRYPVTYFSMEG